MNLRKLGIVYRKELKDLLRDRRTIISMIAVPVFVMPLLMCGVGFVGLKMVKKVMGESSRVMVIGGDDSPKTLAALHKIPNFDFAPPDTDYAKLISDKKIRAAVEIPKNFDAAVESGANTTVQIYDYSSEIKSEAAATALKGFFRKLHDDTVKKRLAERGVPATILVPFNVQERNVAPPEKVSGNFTGAIIPYMIIMMSLMGCIYAAIDLTAGEKERGTMETLLCSPVQRSSIVLGKCLMVMTVSLSTVLLSLCSTGASFVFLKKLTADMGAGNVLPLAINPVSLVIVFAVMLPVTLLFSALMLAAGLFSRSVKEANSYLQPLMVLMVIPAVAASLPGVELDWQLALIPVLNVSLLSKEILSGTYHWGLIALIFGSTCVYAVAALMAAVAMFKRESVVFRT